MCFVGSQLMRFLALSLRPSREDAFVLWAMTALTLVQMARKRSEAPRFIAGSLKDDALVGSLPGLQPRGQRGEVLPAKGPARAPWPKLRLQVSSSVMSSTMQPSDLWQVCLGCTMYISEAALSQMPAC